MSNRSEQTSPADEGPVERPVRPLLERLREAEADYTLTWGSGDLYGEAADMLERLIEERARFPDRPDYVGAMIGAHFSNLRPQLPGQEVPGLGLAREMTQILHLMAKRLMREGVAFRPSWFHMAWAARHGARFVDARRQGRFEPLASRASRWTRGCTDS